MLGVPADETLTVAAGDVVSLAIPPAITDVRETGTNIFEANAPITLPNGNQAWPNSGEPMPTLPYQVANDEVEVRIDAAPGRYVLVVGLFFDGGDVQYGVQLKVH
jgi:hypothetical protein